MKKKKRLSKAKSLILKKKLKDKEENFTEGDKPKINPIQTKIEIGKEDAKKDTNQKIELVKEEK